MEPLDVSSELDTGSVQTVDWQMMDSGKFVGLNMASSMAVRCVVYPLTVVKTRVQLTQGVGLYGGLYATMRRILVDEGYRALYRGFPVNSLQIVSGASYFVAYEKGKVLLQDAGVGNPHVRAFIGGGFASAVGQLLLVPVDIVSQHMMLFRNRKLRVAKNNVDPLNLYMASRMSPNIPLSALVCREVYRRHGLLRGFYCGYFASLLYYAPSSAIFWSLYQFFSGSLADMAGEKVPMLVISALAAPSAVTATATMTNALDLFRTNMQVRGTGWMETFRSLVANEGWGILSKGLSIRILSGSASSLLLITVYELVKRLSVRSDLKNDVRW